LGRRDRPDVPGPRPSCSRGDELLASPPRGPAWRCRRAYSKRWSLGVGVGDARQPWSRAARTTASGGKGSRRRGRPFRRGDCEICQSGRSRSGSCSRPWPRTAPWSRGRNDREASSRSGRRGRRRPPRNTSVSSRPPRFSRTAPDAELPGRDHAPVGAEPALDRPSPTGLQSIASRVMGVSCRARGLGRRQSFRRKHSGHFACGLAEGPAVLDEEEVEVEPVLAGHEGHQVALDLDRVVMAAQPSRRARRPAWCRRRCLGLAVAGAENDVGRLAGDARQGQQLGHGVGPRRRRRPRPIRLAAPTMDLALFRKKPADRMSPPSSALSAPAKASAEGYLRKSPGVIRLTRSSVHWAARMVPRGSPGGSGTPAPSGPGDNGAGEAG